jgi:hypothetical protein
MVSGAGNTLVRHELFRGLGVRQSIAFAWPDAKVNVGILMKCDISAAEAERSSEEEEWGGGEMR